MRPSAVRAFVLAAIAALCVLLLAASGLPGAKWSYVGSKPWHTSLALSNEAGDWATFPLSDVFAQQSCDATSSSTTAWPPTPCPKPDYLGAYVSAGGVGFVRAGDLEDVLSGRHTSGVLFYANYEPWFDVAAAVASPSVREPAGWSVTASEVPGGPVAAELRRLSDRGERHVEAVRHTLVGPDGVAVSQVVVDVVDTSQRRWWQLTLSDCSSCLADADVAGLVANWEIS